MNTPYSPQVLPQTRTKPVRKQQLVKAKHPVPAPRPRRNQPSPIIIEMPSAAPQTETASLSYLVEIGRRYHKICRNAFMKKVQTGYYYYERRIEYQTCAVAAAYVGAFGPESVERAGFSFSMAVWRLSQLVGYDLNKQMVVGPTGRYQSLAREMIQLVDEDGWNREGVAEWLYSIGL